MSVGSNGNEVVELVRIVVQACPKGLSNASKPVKRVLNSIQAGHEFFCRLHIKREGYAP